MKLYIIEDNFSKIFFQTSNRRVVLKKFKELDDRWLSITTDDYPYVVFVENNFNYFIDDFSKKLDAIQKAKELFKEKK